MSSRCPGFCTKTSMIQLGYGIWTNFSTMMLGAAFAFPAVQIPQLRGPNAVVVVTPEEASWIASILLLFCPIGSVANGLVMDRFGRRVMLKYCHIPMFAAWIYTSLSRSGLHLIIARALMGIGSGMAAGTARLYTSEISLPNMRGLLGALPNIFVSVGITLQAALSLFSSWIKLCYIFCAIHVILFVSYFWLTETPYYLLLKKDPSIAKEALAKFRGKDYDLDWEIDDLIEFKSSNNIRSLSCSEKLHALFLRSAYIPFAIIMTYVTLSVLTGGSVVMTWSIEILQESKSSYDVYKGNFIIAFTRLIFGGITSALLFRTRRRTLGIISAGGIFISCLALGIFLHCVDAPSLVPQILLTVYMGFSALGSHIIPFLLMAEMYPLQIRGTLFGISLAITHIEMFAMSKCYVLLRNVLGTPNLILMFASSAFICVIFLYKFMPETKDLTLHEIEEYYNSRRPELSPSREFMRPVRSKHSGNVTNKANV